MYFWIGFTGLLVIARFGIGVWDNFINCKYGYARKAVDIGVFAVEICMIGAGALAWCGNRIKDIFFNDPQYFENEGLKN